MVFSLKNGRKQEQTFFYVSRIEFQVYRNDATKSMHIFMKMHWMVVIAVKQFVGILFSIFHFNRLNHFDSKFNAYFLPNKS